VTVVYDLLLPEADLKALAKDLRHLCASGGTLKEGRIEIRGDHRAQIVSELKRRGFRAKAAGG
jgi:translation initiation factor 1